MLNINSIALGIVIGLASFGMIIGSANATVMVDFEPSGYVVGSSVDDLKPDGTTQAPQVSGTNPDAQAWSVRDSSTESIVNFGGSHGKVWRLDSTGTNQQNRPHSPHAGDLPSTSTKQFSGEPGAIDDFGSETPTTNTFYAQFDFRAVDGTNGFTGNGVVDVYSNCGDDCRHSYIRIIDDGSAFDLQFFDTGIGGFGDFQSHDVDLNLAYDMWHTVAMSIQFIDGQNGDGSGNDIVSYFVDNTLIATATSWETGYRISTSSERGVDRLAFNSSLDSGPGLYFDNILISDAAPSVPEPATLTLFGLGLAGLGFARRRRRAA